MSHPTHPTWHLIALPLPLVLSGFGLNGLFRPTAHLKALGFPSYPANSNPTAQKLNMALMRIWGIRNLVIGTLILRIWATGDERLLAQALCGGAMLAVVDGFVSRGLIGGGEAQHWSFPPVIGVVVAGLYGVFD
jgi:hypothetical protein